MIPENLKPCKTEKVCDDNDATIFPIMKHFVEVEKMSVNRAAIETAGLYPDGNVTKGRAEQLYLRRTSTHVENQKPLRKQTDTETKKQLLKISKEIVNAKVSDDDIKKLDIAISDAISKGIVSVRVGTATATAVKKKQKKKGGEQPKPIDNFKRLSNHLQSGLDGLTLFAEGTMKPETQDEAEHAKAVLATAASFIIQFARLGADIQGIYDTFIQGDTNERKIYNSARVIN